MRTFSILLVIIFVPFLGIAQMQQTEHSAEPARLTTSELLEQLKAELTSLSAKGKFSGVVLIAGDNQSIFEYATGFADRERKIPNTIQTCFNLGSMNKMFTSIAIAQLVEKGKLRYSDKLAGILSDYPDADAAKKITIEHLLTHASGVADLFTPEFMRDREKIHKLKDYLPYFADKPLQFEPGSKRSYSNAGFVVAGLVIERISGQDYFSYVRQHLYKPAGMNTSFGFESRKKEPCMATGYTTERGTLEPNDFALVAGSPAGGGYSTVHDLLKFASALRQHKLVGPDLTRLIIGQDRPLESTYGYGFSREEVFGHLVVGHNGGAEGINGDLDIYWKSGNVVIALANQDPRAAEEITRWVKLRITP
jgi:D-alanyl-D-alanine carboxypeptidase